VLNCCWMMHQLDSCSLASRATSYFSASTSLLPTACTVQQSISSGAAVRPADGGMVEGAGLLVDGLKVPGQVLSPLLGGIVLPP
jgi:hypothetical protein